jgi:hypothetical protein
MDDEDTSTLRAAIAALEGQRATLGDAVLELAIAPLEARKYGDFAVRVGVHTGDVGWAQASTPTGPRHRGGLRAARCCALIRRAAGFGASTTLRAVLTANTCSTFRKLAYHAPYSP